MALISDDYREQNRLLHANPNYGASGARNEKAVRRLLEEYQTRDVLDYGCGKARLRDALGVDADVKLYDPATEFSADPCPADVVVCTDVLEHIEPECLDEVLAHLASKIKKCGYVNVATRPAKKSLPDGRNAHLIVQEASWWLKKVSQHMSVRWSKSVPDLQEVVFLVEPKT